MACIALNASKHDTPARRDFKIGEKNNNCKGKIPIIVISARRSAIWCLMHTLIKNYPIKDPLAADDGYEMNAYLIIR